MLSKDVTWVRSLTSSPLEFFNDILYKGNDLQLEDISYTSTLKTVFRGFLVTVYIPVNFTCIWEEDGKGETEIQ